jgi:hypothetical protein
MPAEAEKKGERLRGSPAGQAATPPAPLTAAVLTSLLEAAAPARPPLRPRVGAKSELASLLSNFLKLVKSLTGQGLGSSSTQGPLLPGSPSWVSPKEQPPACMRRVNSGLLPDRADGGGGPGACLSGSMDLCSGFTGKTVAEGGRGSPWQLLAVGTGWLVGNNSSRGPRGRGGTRGTRLRHPLGRPSPNLVVTDFPASLQSHLGRPGPLTQPPRPHRSAPTPEQLIDEPITRRTNHQASSRESPAWKSFPPGESSARSLEKSSGDPMSETPRPSPTHARGVWDEGGWSSPPPGPSAEDSSSISFHPNTRTARPASKPGPPEAPRRGVDRDSNQI